MKHIIFDCDGTLVDTNGPQYQLYPGIKELLTELSPEHLLYVWTARDRVSTLRILEELELLPLFEDICTFTDAPPKPLTGGLLKLVGSRPKPAICVIGDSAYDMQGAKNFGVLALGAVWNVETNAQLLQESGADFIVSHPFECSKLIQLNLMGDEHV
jgi:phosphoglycolate phosphatase